MKPSIRSICLSIVMLTIMILAATTGARAQGFPLCNAGGITIKNYSSLPIHLCIKHVGCFDIAGNDGLFVPLPPGTEIPGIYGVANVTYTWQPNPNAPPALWIPSIAMLPTGRCFDVFFDQASCTILVDQTVGPPCINP